MRQRSVLVLHAVSLTYVKLVESSVLLMRHLPQSYILRISLDQGPLCDVRMIEKLKYAVVNCDIANIRSLVQSALNADIRPTEVLNALRDGMESVGSRFQSGEYFLSDLIMAGETMKEALRVLKPSLGSPEGESGGKIVLGTILGDLHDIGKDIVGTLLTSAGFRLHDLGVDVPPERYVEEAKKVDADVIGVSALLSTTVRTVPQVCEALAKSGKREAVKVIIGGAAVRKAYVRQLGVDAAVNDAIEGVNVIKSWTSEKHDA